MARQTGSPDVIHAGGRVVGVHCSEALETLALV
jgi:hypothetical protein